MQSLGIYGGSFDPIHNGHLATAIAVQNYFHFDIFHFLPCKQPVMKAPTKATTAARIAMLNLALATYPEFQIDLREVARETQSYMIETLTSYRAEYPTTAITLILGLDSFATFTDWEEWETMLTLANLIVLNRQGYEHGNLSKIVKELLQRHAPTKDKNIKTTLAGTVQQFNGGDYSISSTTIRKNIATGLDVADYLPEAVLAYISTHSLYKKKPQL